VAFDDPNLALIVDVLLVLTAVVVTLNVPLVVPLSRKRLAGTLAAAPVAPSLMVNPLGGAAPESVTVPMAGFPPTKAVGLKLNLEITGGLMVRLTPIEELFSDAVILAVVLLETPVVVIVNLPLVAPAPMTTVLSTIAAAWLLAKLIVKPDPGAGELIFTVPFELFPPTNWVGLRANEVIFGAFNVSVADFVV